MIVDFTSDTTAGVSNEILDAIISANKGCEQGYFKDKHTKNVRKIVQGFFTKPVSTFFVSNGTAVNILALKAMLQGVGSIICADCTHVSKSEMGATEHLVGAKILTVKNKDGKITVAQIKKSMLSIGHNPPIKLVAFSQVTELGTCYAPQEIKTICDFAHANGMYVYIDGARIANALAYLNCSLKELVEDTGVDAFSIGGNKNGCLFGELLVFLNDKFSAELPLYQKQLALTFSKTRFFAAQFEAYFNNDLWIKNAKNSNMTASYLARKLEKLGFEVIYKIESNAVFVQMEYDLLQKLNKFYSLHYTNKATKLVRIMTNFSTTTKDVDEFVKKIKMLIR